MMNKYWRDSFFYIVLATLRDLSCLQCWQLW